MASKADALESAERNDHGIRHAFAFTVGLTDSDALLVLNLAKSLDTQFAALDQQAAAIIQKAHGAVPAGGVVPPPPESLTQLQKQKASLISSLDSVFSAKLNLHSQAAIKQFTRSSHSDQTFSSEPNSKEKPSQ